MLLFKRHSRLFRLFRIAFYLSLPSGMALLIVSQFTQLSTPQAIAAWAFDLATLKSGVFTLRRHYWVFAVLLQEAKMMALIVFGVVCVKLGSNSLEPEMAG